MKFSSNSSKAASIIEYTVLIVMFVTAIFFMYKQIGRSIFGRWRDLGDSFGQGEQYDPDKTLECGRYVPRVLHQGTWKWGTEMWYAQNCYQCCMSTYESTCPGFTSAGGTLNECREEEEALGKRDCCAKGCESSNCTN